MLALHGGPHRVLVDKAGVLDGIVFPLYEPTAEQHRRQIERALSWFWLDAIQLGKHLARRRFGAAQDSLARMRGYCELLVAADGLPGVDGEMMSQRLLATFVASNVGAIVAASQELVAMHRDVGAAVAEPLGLSYPTQLAAVAEGKLRGATQPPPARCDAG